jgi:hypothetical protein
MFSYVYSSFYRFLRRPQGGFLPRLRAPSIACVRQQPTSRDGRREGGRAAVVAAAALAKRPKCVPPEPDMRASRQPGAASSAACTCLRTGATCRAGRPDHCACGYQPVGKRQRSNQAPQSAGPGGAGCHAGSAAAKTCGVGTGTRGLTSTNQSRRQRWQGGKILAHAAHPGRLPRQTDRHIGPQPQHLPPGRQRTARSCRASAAASLPHPPNRHRSPRQPAAACPVSEPHPSPHRPRRAQDEVVGLGPKRHRFRPGDRSERPSPIWQGETRSPTSAKTTRLSSR